MSIQSEIQVHVEDGVFKRATAGRPLVNGFRIFQFIRKSPKSGQYVSRKSSDQSEKTVSKGNITVMGVSKSGDITRFVKMAKASAKDGKWIVAVTSPAIFNQPRYRDLIEGIHIPGVSVLVEEPSTFIVEHLGPWVGRILEAGKVKEKSLPAVPSFTTAIESLDVSARLRDPASGRLDATRISDMLGISKSDIAVRVCGVSRQTLGQNPTGVGIQDKLQPLEDVAQALIWCGGDDAKFRAWLNRPNRDFPEIDGQATSPMDLILRGHASVVGRKVENLRTGHPA